MPPTDAEIPQAVGKPNPRNNSTMFKIFQNVQYNVVQHKKYVKEMKKLYKKIDEDSFRESFKNALQYLFTFGDTSANVDRVVQYVATFCTSLDDEEEFLLFIFDIIFECQCVSGQSVRYRASQLLAAVLSALGDDASLDDDLCDKLLQSQMQRLQDTRGAVRCRAALALQRLQNPMESDDEVTRAYRFHMSCDPNSSVRRAVVMSIAKCSRNVPFVLERLCDVDEAVRRAAFLYISANNVTQLRVRQRVLTLKGIIPSNVGSRRSSHAVRQLSVTKDNSFEEEEESEEEEEESEEKKQKRMEKEVRNTRNKIRHLKEKQENMKRERMAYKMSLKNQQACLKDEKKKYKELKREVDKMAAMMKEVGSEDEEEEEEEEEESEEEKKSETEEESETETEQDTESETESESEPEDAPLPKKKENLSTRLKRHESRVNALKKGNTLLMANVDRLKDDVLKQKEESMSLQKELDSLIDDLE